MSDEVRQWETFRLLQEASSTPDWGQNQFWPPWLPLPTKHPTGGTMHKPTIIYGASDDLVEYEGQVREEFNTDDAVLTVTFAGGGTATVNVKYGNGGTWEITSDSPLVEIRPDAGEDADRRTVTVVGDDGTEHTFTDVTGYSAVAVMTAQVISLTLANDES